MASTELEEEQQIESPATNEIVLEPKLGPEWALAPIHLGVVAVFGVLFMTFNYMPLRATDLWGHVAYGQWILEHRALPTADPVLPLAEGMRVVDSAWLSQVIFAAAEQAGGPEALSTLFALVSIASLAVMTRVFWLQSHRIGVMLLGLLGILIVGLSRLGTIRPENFGVLCFALLLWVFASEQNRARANATNSDDDRGDAKSRGTWLPWIAVPVLMAVWANLHGSFVCGLALLFCMFAGALIDSLWHTRDFVRSLADKAVRRRLYLLELGVAATLLNPYGLDLLLYTLWFANNENLKDVLEWRPLTILGVGGREFALSWVVLLVVLRHSRQRVRAADVLLLGLFTLAAITGVRMMSWYAMSFVYVIVPHLTDLWNRFVPARWREWEVPLELDEAPQEQFGMRRGRTFNYTLIGLLLVWIVFALSPIGRPVVGDEPRQPQLLYDNDTPHELTAYLRENPTPAGLTFCPQWWGDWLVWDGPEGLRPFMTTNLHLAPRQVWRDYQAVSAGVSGWTNALDRYNTKAMIVDKDKQATLARSARRSSAWEIVHEDEMALVLVRREPTVATASESAADAAEPTEPSDDAAADPAAAESSN
ncbi:MAG: hypothetical protein R3C99_09530 [Pirellulaceae bacterium]